VKRLLLIAISFAMLGTGAFADTIRIGVIGSFSGPFAGQGRNFKAGIEAWLAVNGSKVGKNKIQVIYRDVPMPDPAISRALAQELVLGEKVQYLAGFNFTADALAVTPFLQHADVPMVVMNAAASAIVTTSPYVVRTSFTSAQVAMPMGTFARNAGLGKAVTLVSDDACGIEAETAFRTAFEKEEGQIIEAIRMPIAADDFSPMMRRVLNAGVDALFVSLPSGPAARAFIKAYADAGLAAAGIRLLATGNMTQEPDLSALGEPAVGLTTTFHYSVSHQSPENTVFLTAARKAAGEPDELSFPAVGAYDGMYVLSKMIEATSGRQDAVMAIEAVKGLAWMSPRGPVTIDPDSRNLIQTIYLRQVTKEGDRYINKELKAFEKQGDPGLIYLSR
jgi:branched-chain amino acid transport system substrate-binding protein